MQLETWTELVWAKLEGRTLPANLTLHSLYLAAMAGQVAAVELDALLFDLDTRTEGKVRALASQGNHAARLAMDAAAAVLARRTTEPIEELKNYKGQCEALKTGTSLRCRNRAMTGKFCSYHTKGGR